MIDVCRHQFYHHSGCHQSVQVRSIIGDSMFLLWLPWFYEAVRQESAVLGTARWSLSSQIGVRALLKLWRHSIPKIKMADGGQLTRLFLQHSWIPSSNSKMRTSLLTLWMNAQNEISCWVCSRRLLNGSSALFTSLLPAAGNERLKVAWVVGMRCPGLQVYCISFCPWQTLCL
jgi:hypothetical protein